MHRRWLAAAAAGVAGIGSFVIAQTPASAATTVVVNGSTTFQRIDGFGVSEAFGQANSIRNLGSAPASRRWTCCSAPPAGPGSAFCAT